MSEPLPFRGPRADKEPKVVIEKKEYERLQRELRWLRCLEAAGVDNWSGYDYAREIQREDYPDDYYSD